MKAETTAEIFTQKHLDEKRKMSKIGIGFVIAIVSVLIVGAVFLLFRQLVCQLAFQPMLIEKNGRYELSLSESIMLELLPVEAGTFTMGTGINTSIYPPAFSDEPQHKVTLTKDYWIGKYEVTQVQYKAVMGAHSCHSRNEESVRTLLGLLRYLGSKPSPFKKRGGMYPVVQISWYDAQNFCKRLNGRFTSQLPYGYEFRLPTEAEWEYAARGGNKSKGYKYSGSDDIDIVAWYVGNSKHVTYPVGTKQPNELGIYDMSGNVREWCLDSCYWVDRGGVITDTYRDNVTDPLCTTGSDRVTRGGGWSNLARYCRVSDRSCSDPSVSSSNLGFRLVLAPCR